MPGRGFLFVAVLAAVAAAPLLLTNSENRGKLAKWWQSLRTPSARDRNLADWDRDLLGPPNPSTLTAQPGPGPTHRYLAGGHAAGGTARAAAPTLRIDQLFRFDVTPKWVVDNWPRVTTGLIDGELEGMRVTLVTGTSISDLAGSLTYYFDRQLQVERIVFHGDTGDPRPLVTFATRYYQLQPEPATGGWLFATRWNNHPTNVLHVQHAPIVRANNPRGRMKVDFELNRPGAPFGLSSGSQKMLRQAQPTAAHEKRRRLFARGR